MAKYLIEDTTLTAIADSIRAKSGSTGPVSLTNIPTIVEDMSGGDIVNGIVESYLASSGNINANTFVEFVEADKINSSVKTTVCNGSVMSLAAAAVDDSTAVVGYTLDNMPYIVVCKLKNNKMTLGTPVALEATAASYYVGMDIEKIDTNKLVITYDYEDYCKCVIANISGTTCTLGTAVNVVTMGGSMQCGKIAVLSTNKFAIAYYYNYYASQGMGISICSVSGSTITAGSMNYVATGKQASLSHHLNNYKALIPLSSTKLLLIYQYGIENRICGVVLTVSGTSFTQGNEVELISAGVRFRTIMLSSTQTIIFYENLGSTSNIGCVLCTISGTTITTSVITTLNTSYSDFGVAHLADNLYFIGDPRYGAVYRVTSSAITKVYDCDFGNSFYVYAMPMVGLGETTLILPYTQTYSPTDFYILNTASRKIAPATTKIDGITKTACTTTTPGEVWVLNN